MTTLDERTTPLDEERAEEFAARVVAVVNDGCIALLTSVGHQTGLFDTLATLPPSTSTEVADTAGLQERYVREWLDGMTVAGFVEHDGSGRYSLPAEHASCLTTAAGPGNLARLAGFVAMLSEAEQPVVEAFRIGGGVPYSVYTRFHEVMAEDSGAVFDLALVDAVVPIADGLPERLAAGIDVADLGCGRGHAINVLAREFPASRFVGYDFSEDALDHARAEAEQWGLGNARFEMLDVAALDRPDSFDLVTAFDAIHDQAHPATVLANAARSLRPGGTFLMVDINASSHVERNRDIPWAAVLYASSTFHCMTVSLEQGGDGLGTVWGRELAVSMLEDAGFGDVRVEELESDPFNLYYVARVVRR